jgi:hypothetical protein
MSDDAVQRLIDLAVMAERERCAEIMEGLAKAWEDGATKARQEGTFKHHWPFKGTYVAPGHERAAKNSEVAAQCIRRVVTELIRTGMVKKKK